MILFDFQNTYLPQITKSETSVTLQGAYKIWQTQATDQLSRHQAELEAILKNIELEHQQMKTNCTGCTIGDQKCNCTVEVLRENEFDIRILLDTEKGLKWCPKATLDSDFFNCQSETFMRI